MARRRSPRWLDLARASGKRFSPSERPQWLARALARAGVLPAAQAEAAIRAGRVTVNGRAATDPVVVVRRADEVRLDGTAVRLDAPTIVLMFHKPAGAVTAPTDPKGHPTVFDLLARELDPDLARFGWHAVGRLDRDTTGLLLFSNDERFVAHATLPATHLPKRYVARVQGRADDAKLEPLRRGIALDDGPAKPAKVRARGPSEVELTLTEGRFHQVKRMLGAVGLPVTHLHREAVGEISLDVPESGCRRLSEEEIEIGLGFPPGPAATQR